LVARVMHAASAGKTHSDFVTHATVIMTQEQNLIGMHIWIISLSR